MPQYGTWVSYGGTARIVLAVVMVAAAGSVVYAGTLLPLPLRPARPGEAARTFMLVIWGIAITAFLVCVPIYVRHARAERLYHGAPPTPIFPITATCMVVIFVVILLVSRSHGQQAVLMSAAIGAVAGPMIFEFPFDLIVMARTYPPIPPDPALYRVLFFAPLFLVEFTTLALLRLSPLVKLSRASFFFFAVMLVVFAVWGLSGFGYPSAPVPFALNVLSKIVAFGAVLSLFIFQRVRPARQGRQSAHRPRSRTPATGMCETGKTRDPAVLLTLARPSLKERS